MIEGAEAAGHITPGKVCFCADLAACGKEIPKDDPTLSEHVLLHDVTDNWCIVPAHHCGAKIMCLDTARRDMISIRLTYAIFKVAGVLPSASLGQCELNKPRLVGTIIQTFRSMCSNLHGHSQQSFLESANSIVPI